MTQPDIYRPMPNNVSPWAIETMTDDQLARLPIHAAGQSARAAAANAKAIWSVRADYHEADQAHAAARYWMEVATFATDELADRLHHANRRLSDVTARLAQL